MDSLASMTGLSCARVRIRRAAGMLPHGRKRARRKGEGESIQEALAGGTTHTLLHTCIGAFRAYSH